MVLLEIATYIGLMSGSLASSFIYTATSATAVFAISALIIGFATIFIACFVPESLNTCNSNREESKRVNDDSVNRGKCVSVAHHESSKVNNNLVLILNRVFSQSV